LRQVNSFNSVAGCAVYCRGRTDDRDRKRQSGCCLDSERSRFNRR